MPDDALLLYFVGVRLKLLLLGRQQRTHLNQRRHFIRRLPARGHGSQLNYRPPKHRRRIFQIIKQLLLSGSGPIQIMYQCIHPNILEQLRVSRDPLRLYR